MYINSLSKKSCEAFNKNIWRLTRLSKVVKPNYNFNFEISHFDLLPSIYKPKLKKVNFKLKEFDQF